MTLQSRKQTCQEMSLERDASSSQCSSLECMFPRAANHPPSQIQMTLNKPRKTEATLTKTKINNYHHRSQNQNKIIIIIDPCNYLHRAMLTPEFPDLLTPDP